MEIGMGLVAIVAFIMGWLVGLSFYYLHYADLQRAASRLIIIQEELVKNAKASFAKDLDKLAAEIKDAYDDAYKQGRRDSEEGR